MKKDKEFKNEIIIDTISGILSISMVVGGMLLINKRKYVVDEFGTAIISSNGNVMLIDIESYDRIHEKESDIWILHTINNDTIYVDKDDVLIVDNHDIAEEMALDMVLDDGHISHYGKNKTNNKKLIFNKRTIL